MLANTADLIDVILSIFVCKEFLESWSVDDFFFGVKCAERGKERLGLTRQLHPACAIDK